MKNIPLLIVIFWTACIFGQIKDETLAPNYIRSIEFTGNPNITGNPIVQLGEKLTLEFDDIIGDEADYYYTINHYNFNWIASELVKSEYIDGFDDTRIYDYENSFNTLQPYTHYKLTIPNKDTKGLKVSGNYMLKVFNSNKELVFSRKFMVYQPIAHVAVTIKRSRELNFINSKHVVNFSVDSPDLLLRNPEQTVKTIILQNHNLKTAIKDIQPQYSIGNQLIYKYDQQTAFWAGNEYLNFDSKEERSSTISISKIELLDLYHHYLFTNSSRDSAPYSYNPDINGQFVIRTLQGINSSIEADYIWTHFSLQNFDPLDGGEIHIYGAFNNFELGASTLMTYNKVSGLYKNAQLFKQGFYNYKYVLLRKDGSIDEGFFNGNFDKTENEYQVLVYYRDLGSRYDQIIGLGSANSLNITN
jgi:hypothetical protein